MQHDALFDSFFVGGLECSAHRLHSGKRLDLLSATRHDHFAVQDFERLRDVGIRTARSGLRWHRIEKAGRLDFGSELPMLRAARDTGISVVWDLCHYGYPEELEPLSPKFIDHFARYARAAAEVVAEHSSEVWLAPINEISFWAWAAGVGSLNPFQGSPDAFKRQFVRATIAATEAIWEAVPHARIVHTDPITHVAPASSQIDDLIAAEGYRLAQYQAWDMLSGRMFPELGGHPKYLDVLGLNYYPHNQWVLGGERLAMNDERRRPLHELLREVHWRYGRPLFIAETGTEDEARALWLKHVCDEVALAQEAGVPVGGVCWYPILNHPGWDDERHCHNGLWDYADAGGNREIHTPLAEELSRQQLRFEKDSRQTPQQVASAA